MSDLEGRQLLLKCLDPLDLPALLLFELLLLDLFLEVVDGLEKSPDFLGVHLVQGLYLLFAARVPLLEFLVLLLECGILLLGLVDQDPRGFVRSASLRAD